MSDGPLSGMVPFYELFPDQARDETRVMHVTQSQPDLPAGGSGKKFKRCCGR